MYWIIDNMLKSGPKSALIFENIELTYSDLFHKISKFKNLISIIPEGSTVALISEYSEDSIAMFFALYKNRNIIVPITTNIEKIVNSRIRVSAADYIIDLNKSQDYWFENTNSSQIKHKIITKLIDNRNAGLIIFSSGSTGDPKAMVHNLDDLIKSYENKKEKNLVFLLFLMFDHIGGLNTLLNCISARATMVFPSERRPDRICYLIEKFKVNVLPTSPTFLNLILISESYKTFDLSSLKLITYGTEPMPIELLKKLSVISKTAKFVQTFGTSETGITQTTSLSSKSTFIRIEDSNTNYKIVDNELWLRSKTQILGYMNYDMSRFTEDGWFKTGDIVETDNDGFIKIIGRNQETINVGGEKVLPSEIESILYQIPGIQDCIVFGEKNAITGQMVVAKILFSHQVEATDLKKIVWEHCLNKIERFKIPVKVEIMSVSEYTDRFKKRRPPTN